MSNDVQVRIDSAQALHNILAIMRLHWPKDVIHQSDMLTGLGLIDGNYYTFDPQYATEGEARASITEHMRNNMRKILSKEKTRADKKIQKDGGDYRKSAFAKAARGRVRTPYTSGSYTFEHRRRDYKCKHGEEQDIIEHFKDTHTLRKKKQSDQIFKVVIDAIIVIVI
ncbi:hypothetical protein POM88_018609 [Heracleum sosnowskyi]|uniref:Uncharacterized protein n=1 Tax=Heracleum sosnowskyi TaxID=360622 RepID=A0AAD8IT97_9APIA|nr:hypothetical protein POM88_018609 [Heracleum sosnowskyi]